jgi:Flp pilus assembly pilin Flp
MFKLKHFAKKILKDQKGQGTAEYVLLIAIVVGALAFFGPKIKQMVQTKWGQISTDMDAATQ